MLTIRTKNLIKLGLIVAVFLAPLIAANLYYYYGHKQGGVTNLGQLMDGTTNLSNLELTTDSFSSPSLDKFKDSQWRVLYFAKDECDAQCQNILYKIQQVHIALGKNLHRFTRTIVHAKADANWQEIYNTYPHMNAVLAQKTLANLPQDKLYVADPNGNIMMNYDLNDSSFDSKLFKDMKKLLNLSKIG